MKKSKTTKRTPKTNTQPTLEEKMVSLDKDKKEKLTKIYRHMEKTLKDESGFENEDDIKKSKTKKAKVSKKKTVKQTKAPKKTLSKNETKKDLSSAGKVHVNNNVNDVLKKIDDSNLRLVIKDKLKEFLKAGTLNIDAVEKIINTGGYSEESIKTEHSPQVKNFIATLNELKKSDDDEKVKKIMRKLGTKEYKPAFRRINLHKDNTQEPKNTTEEKEEEVQVSASLATVKNLVLQETGFALEDNLDAVKVFNQKIADLHFEKLKIEKQLAVLYKLREEASVELLSDRQITLKELKKLIKTEYLEKCAKKKRNEDFDKLKFQYEIELEKIHKFMDLKNYKIK